MVDSSVDTSVVASVQLADVGFGTALNLLRSAPKPGSIPGLRQANVAAATPLGSSPPKPSLRRVGVIAFWDDNASLTRFLAEHPIADALKHGWHARLQPLRAHGTWPGLPDELPRARGALNDDAAIVLTLGRLRMTHVRRFLRASRPAETAAIVAPGFVWGTALARPPFVATCSLWENARAITSYAYGGGDPGHPEAIAEQQRKDFHKQSAFIRFRPYDVNGGLSGKNPLPERALAT